MRESGCMSISDYVTVSNGKRPLKTHKLKMFLIYQKCMDLLNSTVVYEFSHIYSISHVYLTCYLTKLFN